MNAVPFQEKIGIRNSRPVRMHICIRKEIVRRTQHVRQGGRFQSETGLGRFQFVVRRTHHPLVADFKIIDLGHGNKMRRFGVVRRKKENVAGPVARIGNLTFDHTAVFGVNPVLSHTRTARRQKQERKKELYHFQEGLMGYTNIL